jgi:pteridine reductase
MTTGTPVALVTGSAKRVGRAIVLELARAGYDVVIHFHTSGQAATSLAGEVSHFMRRAVTIRGDLANENEWPRIVEKAVAAMGRLDVLVNNASLFLMDRPDTLADFSVELWQRMFRVNLFGPVALCHYAAPHISESGNGCVINLCDSSVDQPWPGHLAYAASKGALVTATKALAKALAPRVRVNGVSPGIAVFPDSYSPAFRQKLIDQVPLGRAGTPEDIARTVRLLIDGAPYITGQIIAVDGGRNTV